MRVDGISGNDEKTPATRLEIAGLYRKRAALDRVLPPLRAAVPTGPGGLPVFLFNWLFPVFIVYLLLTVGQRRR